MTKKFSILLTSILLFSFLQMDCKDDPPVVHPPSKNMRKLTWTIDTISYEIGTQTLLYKIWGTSPQDVYASGFNGSGWGELYHFDGESWSVVIHGHKSIDVGQVFGFASNDVWLVGGYFYINPSPPPNFLDSSVILHFDGQQWNEIPIQRTEGLTSIWGDQSNQLIAGGKHGALLRYVNGIWQSTYIDKRLTFLDFTGIDNSIYALAYIAAPETEGNIGKAFILKQQDTNFIIIDSITTINDWANPKFGEYAIQTIGKKLYSTGSGVFESLDGITWKKCLETYPNNIFGIFGTNGNNIFACGSGNTLYHWNGTDWVSLEIPGDPSLPLYGVWCDDNEVFVIGEDGHRSYVIHGK